MTKTSDQIAIRDKARALANQLVSYEWNSTSRESTASVILKILGPNYDRISNLAAYLAERKTDMDKRDKYNFDIYFGKGILETVSELMNTGYGAIPTGLAIKDAIKNNFLYKGFNWKNYNRLVTANLPELFTTFDTDFRGDILSIEKINDDKYLVIQTSEDKEDGPRFYAMKKNDKGEYRHDNCVWHSFDDALISVMFPTYNNAVRALLKSEQEN